MQRGKMENNKTKGVPASADLPRILPIFPQPWGPHKEDSVSACSFCLGPAQWAICSASVLQKLQKSHFSRELEAGETSAPNNTGNLFGRTWG